MPKFRVQQYELHIAIFEVEAVSAAAAVRRVNSGELSTTDYEYIEIADAYGMVVPPDFPPDLTSFVPLQPAAQYVPGIRCVEELPKEPADVPTT